MTIGVAGWVLELLYPSGETILFYVVFSQGPTLGTHVDPLLFAPSSFLSHFPHFPFGVLGDYLSNKWLALKILVSESALGGARLRHGVRGHLS